MDCSFCGHGIPRGTEMIFVTKRGKALYFCSSKCERNMLKLGRKPRETKWTDDYREEKLIRVKSAPVQLAPAGKDVKGAIEEPKAEKAEEASSAKKAEEKPKAAKKEISKEPKKKKKPAKGADKK